MSADALVVFMPSGRRGRVPRGASRCWMRPARLGVDLDSVLRRPRDLRPLPGDGRRGRACEARDLLHLGAPLSTPVTETEEAYAADRGLAAGRRLGCTALVAEDVVIDVPPESQVFRQVVRKEADARSIAVDPVVRLYFVEVEEPQLASPRSDLARLLGALEANGACRSFRRSELSCGGANAICVASRPGRSRRRA